MARDGRDQEPLPCPSVTGPRGLICLGEGRNKVGYLFQEFDSGLCYHPPSLDALGGPTAGHTHLLEEEWRLGLCPSGDMRACSWDTGASAPSPWVDFSETEQRPCFRG